MLDLGWSEIMLIGVVALVVIGPKELPHAIYAAGKWARKARMVAREFQGHFDDMMREAEMDELRQQALKARDMNLVKALEESVDPAGDIRKSMELPSVTSAITADEAKTTHAQAPAEPNILAPETPAESTEETAVPAPAPTADPASAPNKTV